MEMRDVAIGVALVGGLFVLGGACSKEYPPTPPPRTYSLPTPQPTPYPTVEYAQPTQDEPEDVYVDVDHEDDDRRNSRWCPTRFC
jgi:hypothetical protein